MSGKKRRIIWQGTIDGDYEVIEEAFPWECPRCRTPFKRRKGGLVPQIKKKEERDETCNED